MHELYHVSAIYLITTIRTSRSTYQPPIAPQLMLELYHVSAIYRITTIRTSRSTYQPPFVPQPFTSRTKTNVHAPYHNKPPPYHPTTTYRTIANHTSHHLPTTHRTTNEPCTVSLIKYASYHQLILHRTI